MYHRRCVSSVPHGFFRAVFVQREWTEKATGRHEGKSATTAGEEALRTTTREHIK